MKLKLVNKIQEASGTKSFFWEPEKKVNYLPGQYYYFTLPKLNYPDPRGTTRHFTISSSPTEGKILRLTTRVREQSGFKKTMDELPIGSVIEGEGPNGTFILDESEKDKDHILLAGGIGITPFRCFIKYAVDSNLKTRMHLIYSNSTPEEITFKKELTEWVKVNPNIKIDMTVTKPEEGKEKWNGLTGRIDKNLLQKLITKEELSSSTFWVVGPPAMVDAMEEALGSLKVPSSNTRTEKFTGY